jgi:hypothetical protein
VAHTILLCTITGTNVIGGGRQNGNIQNNSLTLGIFVNGTLRRLIPFVLPTIGGSDSPAFLAFYAPINNVPAGLVTVDLRIRKGSASSAPAFLTGAVLQVIEI